MRPTRCQLRHESEMRHPGIEPGAPRWQRGILPLNQWRLRCKNKNGVRSGIRTHAPEETGALNQRLRPLGHPNTRLAKNGLPGWTRTTDLGIAAAVIPFTVPRSTN